jgi:hypothetical protein
MACQGNSRRLLLRLEHGDQTRCDWLVRRWRNAIAGDDGAAGAGRSVKGGLVLIDSVLTTGATDEGCARVLRRAGAAHVVVMVLARVFKAGG